MANTCKEMGNYSRALQKFDEALLIARGMSDLYQEAKIHSGIADVTLRIENGETAKIHWRQALDIFQNLNVPEALEVEMRLQALDDLAS